MKYSLDFFQPCKKYKNKTTGKKQYKNKPTQLTGCTKTGMQAAVCPMPH